MVSVVTRIGNAQNGILEMIVENGVVTAAAFLGMVMSISYCGSALSRRLSPLYALMFVFLTCSFVEICFDMEFLFVMASLHGAVLHLKNNPEEAELFARRKHVYFKW